LIISILDDCPSEWSVCPKSYLKTEVVLSHQNGLDSGTLQYEIYRSAVTIVKAVETEMQGTKILYLGLQSASVDFNLTLQGVPGAMDDIKVEYFRDVTIKFLDAVSRNDFVSVLDIEVDEQRTARQRQLRGLQATGSNEIKGTIFGAYPSFLEEAYFGESLEDKFQENEALYLNMLNFEGIKPGVIEVQAFEYFEGLSSAQGQISVPERSEQQSSKDDTSNKDKSGKNLVIFLALGIVACLLVIAGIFFFVRHKRKEKIAKQERATYREEMRKERQSRRADCTENVHNDVETVRELSQSEDVEVKPGCPAIQRSQSSGENAVLDDAPRRAPPRRSKSLDDAEFIACGSNNRMDHTHNIREPFERTDSTRKVGLEDEQSDNAACQKNVRHGLSRKQSFRALRAEPIQVGSFLTQSKSAEDDSEVTRVAPTRSKSSDGAELGLWAPNERLYKIPHLQKSVDESSESANKKGLDKKLQSNGEAASRIPPKDPERPHLSGGSEEPTPPSRSRSRDEFCSVLHHWISLERSNSIREKPDDSSRSETPRRKAPGRSVSQDSVLTPELHDYLSFARKCYTEHSQRRLNTGGATSEVTAPEVSVSQAAPTLSKSEEPSGSDKVIHKEKNKKGKTRDKPENGTQNEMKAHN